MKHKRMWSDEQKARARVRMEERWSQKRTEAEAIRGQQMREQNIESGAQDMGSVSTVTRDRDPEIQAVLESMTPERRAKLASIQARNLAQLSQTKEGREALERMEVRHSDAEQNMVPQVQVQQNIAVREQPIVPPEPPRSVVREVPFKTPFRLTGSQSGLMISELGNCICGEQKLEWHPICLKVKV